MASSQQQKHDNSIWLALQYSLVTAMDNWEATIQETAGTPRHEGWTEQFGDDKIPPPQWFVMEESVIDHCVFATPTAGQPGLVLTQYRPAWREQLALAIANVPYVLVNSHYACSQTTGPLPYLTSYESIPKIVGRNQDILKYLAEQYHLQFEPSDPQLAMQHAVWTRFVEATLTPSLSVLRYHDSAVDRKQRKQAGGWWQAWSEGVVARHDENADMGRTTTVRAVDEARHGYAQLEAQLESHEYTYLLTDQPLLVDLLVFDHWMQAVLDMHLVVVLADYPRLTRYIQNIWNQYFDIDVENTKECPDWKRWNAQENAANAFCQLPLLSTKKNTDEDELDTVVQLMKKLSVRTHDFQQHVVLAQEQRQTVPTRRPLRTWHAWRFGREASSSTNTAKVPPVAKEDNDTDRMRQEIRRQDQAWLTGLGIITVLTAAAFVASQSSSSSSVR